MLTICITIFRNLKEKYEEHFDYEESCMSVFRLKIVSCCKRNPSESNDYEMEEPKRKSQSKKSTKHDKFIDQLQRELQ